jgi:hypothetical protein
MEKSEFIDLLAPINGDFGEYRGEISCRKKIRLFDIERAR